MISTLSIQKKISLKEYWLVMRHIKEAGLIESVLRLELKRMFHAIDEEPRFMKLLGLVTTTLYAIDTPEAIDAADKFYDYLKIE